MIEASGNSSSLQEHIIQTLHSLNYNISPQDIWNLDAHSLNNNLPSIIKKLPYLPTNHYEALQQMRKCREAQEVQVASGLERTRKIDFIAEVAQINPELGKLITECSSSPNAIKRVLQGTKEKINNTLKASNHQNLFDQAGIRAKYDIDNRENINFMQLAPENEDLNIFNMKNIKQDQWAQDLGTVFRKEDELDFLGLLSPEVRKSEGSSVLRKRVPFGFSKVENILESNLFNDDFLGESNDASLREINNYNFDNNYVNKFLHFA